MYKNTNHFFEQAFTIIELIVVLTVISTLTLAAFVSAGGPKITDARDKERSHDIETIAQQLERYYRTNSVSLGSTYPASTVTADTLAGIIKDADSVSAPGTTQNSLVVANSSGQLQPALNQYAYQALNVDGTLCTATPCARFSLYYRRETDGAIVEHDSMRQQ